MQIQIWKGCFTGWRHFGFDEPGIDVSRNDAHESIVVVVDVEQGLDDIQGVDPELEAADEIRLKPD
jgi:hypothetical protein